MALSVNGAALEVNIKSRDFIDTPSYINMHFSRELTDRQ